MNPSHSDMNDFNCTRCGARFTAERVARDFAGMCPNCLVDFSSGTVAADPEPPPAIPGIEIVERIGRGGMGTVYRARQTKLARDVAVKVLPAALAEDPEFVERFNREARALASLSHPNIVAVHEFGEAGGRHYIVMEFVGGTNLRDVIRSRKMAPREAFAIVPQLCDALEYAHDAGVVHRDIKPENILLDKKGRVKIADFGIAKIVGREPQRLTETLQVIGTMHYMAPEQYENPRDVDHRADIYSMGVVFYEMLTGELPIGRFAPPSSRVEVDVRFDEIVLRTLEKEPARRYQKAADVRTDVARVSTTPPPSRTSPVPILLAVGLVAAVVLLGVVGTLAVWMLMAKPEPVLEPAPPPADDEVVYVDPPPVRPPLDPLVERQEDAALRARLAIERERVKNLEGRFHAGEAPASELAAARHELHVLEFRLGVLSVEEFGDKTDEHLFELLRTVQARYEAGVAPKGDVLDVKAAALKLHEEARALMVERGWRPPTLESLYFRNSDLPDGLTMAGAVAKTPAETAAVLDGFSRLVPIVPADVREAALYDFSLRSTGRPACRFIFVELPDLPLFFDLVEKLNRGEGSDGAVEVVVIDQAPLLAVGYRNDESAEVDRAFEALVATVRARMLRPNPRPVSIESICFAAEDAPAGWTMSEQWHGIRLPLIARNDQERAIVVYDFSQLVSIGPKDIAAGAIYAFSNGPGDGMYFILVEIPDPALFNDLAAKLEGGAGRGGAVRMAVVKNAPFLGVGFLHQDAPDAFEALTAKLRERFGVDR